MKPLPTIVPAKRRVHRKRRVVQAGSTPPVSGPHILSVAHHPTDDLKLVVTFSSAVVSVGETQYALRVYLPGVYWLPASEIVLESETTVFVSFEESVATATEWIVPAPEVWEFVGGAVMELPFSGAVG